MDQLAERAERSLRLHLELDFVVEIAKQMIKVLFGADQELTVGRAMRAHHHVMSALMKAADLVQSV